MTKKLRLFLETVFLVGSAHFVSSHIDTDSTKIKLHLLANRIHP